MSEPNIEEIVARLEKFTSMFAPDSLQDIGALIASWRLRGEALQAANGYADAIREVIQRLDRIELKLELADLCAALKDEP